MYKKLLQFLVVLRFYLVQSYNLSYIYLCFRRKRREREAADKARRPLNGCPPENHVVGVLVS